MALVSNDGVQISGSPLLCLQFKDVRPGAATNKAQAAAGSRRLTAIGSKTAD
jgi:hypothetical protein